ncbi:S-formylglutathione hydrolase FrmB [Spirosomataceae bacterium TFI 002]|nr:S-formylglutathione hydrolase FrmB [Spirosomataceae bacterium TFI 002]
MSKFFTTEKANIGELDFITVKSNAIGHRADVSVYVPKGKHHDIPVVILLHGVYGSHWAWALKAEVHKTLKELIESGDIPPMLLVMPSDGLFQDGSGYLTHQEADYEKWIVEDVPELLKENYPQVSESSPLFLTGLSMGGYGALRLGAKYPTVFSAFSGLSSITRFEQMEQFVKDIEKLKSAVKKQENVLEVILANKENLKPFRFDCGKEDQLFVANQNLHQALIGHGIPHQYFEYDGEHSWDYWKEHIRETLSFFGKYT